MAWIMPARVRRGDAGLADQLGDTGLEEIALAEVAGYGAADPIEELRQQWPVETIGLADRLDVGGGRVWPGDRCREVARQARQDEGQGHHGRRDEQGDD